MYYNDDHAKNESKNAKLMSEKDIKMFSDSERTLQTPRMNAEQTEIFHLEIAARFNSECI